MDRAGLGYDYNSMPPNLIGATANFSTGYARVPRNGNSFLPSPVRAHVMRNFAKQTFANNFATRQNLQQRNSAYANLVPNFGAQPTFGGGVRANTTPRNVNRRALTSDTYNVVPRPCTSLVSRLSTEEKSVVMSRERFTNMKSVDRTATSFKKRFSGLPSEKWIQHLDSLELDRAKKHNWTPKEFYYGLRLTLQGRALNAIRNLEKDLDRPDFSSLIPDWFEPAAAEWRELCHGKAMYSTLSERTKIAILIVYFHLRFQRTSGDSAYSDFIYSAQATNEALEEWGISGEIG